MPTAKKLFQRHPIVVTSTALLSVVGFSIFMLAMLFGAGALLRSQGGQSGERRVFLAAFSLFPLFVFGASQVVNAMQSRHRAPVEFVIAVLFFVGIHALSQRSRHRLQAQKAAH